MASDDEVKSRSSQRNFERQESEIEMQGMIPQDGTQASGGILTALIKLTMADQKGGISKSLSDKAPKISRALERSRRNGRV